MCIIYGGIAQGKGLSCSRKCMRILSHLQGAYNFDSPETGKKAQKRLVLERLGSWGAQRPRLPEPGQGWARGKASCAAGKVSRAARWLRLCRLLEEQSGALPDLLPVSPPSTELGRF